MSEPESSLAEMMRAARRGDAESYKRALQVLAPVLRGFVRNVIGRYGANPDETEDVVQEALLAVHLKRDTWDDGQPILPWARAIARNKLIDSLRRKGRRVHLPIDDVAETLADERVPEADRVDSARVLARLKPRQRDIVTAIALEGKSAAEVAAQLGMTETAVRVALHRSLQGLAAVFRDKGFGNED